MTASPPIMLSVLDANVYKKRFRRKHHFFSKSLKTILRDVYSIVRDVCNIVRDGAPSLQCTY